MTPPSILGAVALVTCMTAPAGAQTGVPATRTLRGGVEAGVEHLMLSGAVQRDVQRFAEGDVPNRLDGSAAGWMVGADVRFRNHLALAVEWSDAGTIEDIRTTALDINGRPVVITSTFRHHTTNAAALGGFSHLLSSRVRLAYLGGVSFTQVGRKFASNASGVVLVDPSDPSPAGLSALFDRFRSLTGGVDTVVRIKQRLHAVAGLRAQRITLPPDGSGWSLRTFVGARWRL